MSKIGPGIMSKGFLNSIYTTSNKFPASKSDKKMKELTENLSKDLYEMLDQFQDTSSGSKINSTLV